MSLEKPPEEAQTQETKREITPTEATVVGSVPVGYLFGARPKSDHPESEGPTLGTSITKVSP